MLPDWAPLWVDGEAHLWPTRRCAHCQACLLCHLGLGLPGPPQATVKGARLKRY